MHEKIKDKIRKLLALSEGSDYENESYVALQKAQALMAEYKLSEKDINPEEPKKCISKRTSFSYGTRSSDHYLNTLATIIADNFCCINYVSTPHKSRTLYICFMGLEEDVTVAIEAFTLANSAIIRGYNRVWKMMCEEYNMDYIPAKYFNPAKLGYIEGYLAGLESVLKTQREQNQEWGLVLVAPKEATDFIKGLKSVTYDNPTPISDTYYDEGYKDGSKFNMNKQLEQL